MEETAHKIIITGPFWSGKTTFIQTVTDKFKNDERYKLNNELYMAMDWGVSVLDDATEIWFFAAPNSRRFDYMQAWNDSFWGVILLFDSSKPETFREAKAMIETIHYYSPAPFVIAANKQDRLEAWDMEALRIGLRLPPEIPFLPCIATDKASVNAVVIALCEEMLKEMATV